MQSYIAGTVTICTNKDFIAGGKNLQHCFRLGLTSWLAKHPQESQNTFQSYRVRLPEACLARTVSFCWLQAAHGEGAEITYWQEAEANALLALCCLFRAVHSGFSATRKEGSASNLSAITLLKLGELRFFCQKFTLV